MRGLVSELPAIVRSSLPHVRRHSQVKGGRVAVMLAALALTLFIHPGSLSSAPRRWMERA
jgi:hypothetical protein